MSGGVQIDGFKKLVFELFAVRVLRGAKGDKAKGDNVAHGLGDNAVAHRQFAAWAVSSYRQICPNVNASADSA